jgi:hypothetical protein
MLLEDSMEYPECAVGKSIALIRSKKENESYQAISYMTTLRAKSLSFFSIWTAMPDMYNPRSNFAIEVIDDLLFCIGGSKNARLMII